eukprot:6286771-Prorocentrum_lima.AAC.1
MSAVPKTPEQVMSAIPKTPEQVMSAIPKTPEQAAPGAFPWRVPGQAAPPPPKAGFQILPSAGTRLPP